MASKDLGSDLWNNLQRLRQAYNETLGKNQDTAYTLRDITARV